nr:glycosyltransferase family 2 protein [uncultured Butyrivibrio sp.]
MESRKTSVVIEESVDPIVSIIIPAYNSEKYIKDSLLSVLQQSFCSIQIIIVDDGSTDKTREIVTNIAEKDSRIELFCKDNGGVGSARNYGIKYARGKYLAFIDSDDSIGERYIENLIKEIRDNNIKLSISGYSLIYEVNSSENKRKRVTPTHNGKYVKEEFIKEMKTLIDNRIMIAPFAKLFVSKIVKEKAIFFNTEISIGEDLLFNLAYINALDCKNEIILSNQSDYEYHIRKGSLTHDFGRNRIKMQDNLYAGCVEFCNCYKAYELEEKLAKQYFKGLMNCIDSDMEKKVGKIILRDDIQTILSLGLINEAITGNRYLQGKRLFWYDIELMLYRAGFKSRNIILLMSISWIRCFIKKKIRGY